MTSPPRSAAAPVGCTNLKLRQLTRRVGQHYDHIVGAAGVKTTQYSLLSYIVKLAPVRPSDLAKVMEMEASTLTRNLQPLVAAGWVVIGPGVDGRSRVVTATDTGRAKRAEAQAEWKRAQQALNERLGVDKVLQLHALLDECLGLMSDTSGESDD